MAASRSSRSMRRLRVTALAALLCGLARGGWLFAAPPPSLVGRPITAAPSTRAGQVQRAAGPYGEPSGPFKLRYFDGRGVAETARMLFAVAGEEFEDSRYPFSFGTPGDFSTIKREEFEADKAAGKMDIALGKVPILEAGPDFQLPQSKAIERYLATKFGLMGSTPEEAAWVDAICEHVRDVNDAYRSKGLFGMKDAEKKAEIEKKWFEEELPSFLQKVEKSLPSSDGYAVGGKISLADVVLFKLLKDTWTDKDTTGTYADCPKLSAIVATMDGHDGLSKWIAERPKTMF